MEIKDFEAHLDHEYNLQRDGADGRGSGSSPNKGRQPRQHRIRSATEPVLGSDELPCRQAGQKSYGLL